MKKLSLLILVLMMSVLVLSAQDDDAPSENPLLEMLALVPDAPESRAGEIYFNDRVAITEAYPEAVVPQSWAEFEGIMSVDEAPEGDIFGWTVWWRVFMNTASSQMSTYMMLGDEYPETVGFDFFDVERELFYGRPPATALIIDGEFERETIREAFGTLGFVDASTGDAEVWCAEADCDTGMDVNPSESEPANPFGGNLGRRQPLVIADNYLMSSPDFLMVESHLDAADGNKTSLAEVPEYLAGVEAISQFGPLMQAMILDGETLDTIRSASGLSPRMTPEQQQAVITEQLEDFVEMPAYDLLLIGDTATEDTHIGMVALVYGDVDTAESAAIVIEERLSSYESLLQNRSLLEILEERYLSLETSVVESNGLGVLLVQFAAPKGTGEEIIEVTTRATASESELEIPPPGVAYRLLYNMLLSLDTGWLTTITRADLEAMLND